MKMYGIVAMMLATLCLTACGGGDSGSSVDTGVTAVPVKINSFSASKTSFLSGTSATFNWTGQGIEFCNLSVNNTNSETGSIWLAASGIGSGQQSTTSGSFSCTRSANSITCNGITVNISSLGTGQKYVFLVAESISGRMILGWPESSYLASTNTMMTF